MVLSLFEPKIPSARHILSDIFSCKELFIMEVITGGNNYFGRRFQICFLKCRNTRVSELGRLEASGDRYKRSAG